MTDEPEMPGSTPEEQEQAEMHAHFSKIADLARKSTEDHIAQFTGAFGEVKLLDPYNLGFAVLCGVVSAAVTALVGLGDTVGDSPEEQAGSLNGLATQMAGVFNEIQARKAMFEETAGATRQ